MATVSSSAKPRAASYQVVGLRQVAEELNLSVSLVSKVLSGRMGTSSATERTILAVRAKAMEMGYRKNELAEALRTGRQNVIAVCIHRHGVTGSSIVEDMVQGIAEGAARHHQRLMLQYCQDLSAFRRFGSGLHRNVVDGLIVGGLPHPEWVNELRKVAARGVPVATLHDWEVAPEFANVGMDQVELCRQATLHLLDQGCRRIAHIRPASDEPGALSDLRFEGYRRALASRRVAYRPQLVVSVGHGFSYESGIEGVRALLASRVPFDGIVGQSDQHAMAALNVLVREGVRVPGAVRIIGVDNSPFCALAIVPLSSMSQEVHARGKRAVELLVEVLNGGKARSVKIEPVVCARQSSLQEK